MPRLIYVREIEPDSWLHWSYKGNASCLRDFRSTPPIEIRLHTSEHIRQLLHEAGNLEADAPSHPVVDLNYWRNYVSEKNVQSGLAIEQLPRVEDADLGVDICIAAAPVNVPYRLVDRFKSDIKPLLEYERHSELATLLKSWRQRFACIKDKETCFNHWDNDDASHLISSGTGIGWTAKMLEYCRNNAVLSFIDVRNHPSLDFALVSMELNLGISSRCNYFRLNAQDYVKPDGLGVRRDASYCVVEVKGPNDEGDLLEATLQALCGTLAIYSKREMINRIAMQGQGRRPSIGRPHLPDDGPSLGIYVVMAKYAPNGRSKLIQDPDMLRKVRLLLEACPIVREVVHFVVESTTENIHELLKEPIVYRRDGDTQDMN